VTDQLRRLPRKAWLALGSAAVLLLLWALLRPQNKPVAVAPSPRDPATARSQAPTASAATGVAALGRLEPAGDVRTLAAPSGGMGVSPRVSELYVREGESVRRGQVLASFDNRPGLLAQRQLLLTRIAALETQLRIFEGQMRRYRGLTRSGANPAGDLDDREIQLSDKRARLNEARAELNKLDTEVALSQLRSPIDGLVLRVFVQPGERPGGDGILEVGANQTMEAIAEVYESDISRVRLGQQVRLESESGGYNGTVMARVIRISPQVRQRKVMSTDPSADADARIVEVRLALDPSQSSRLRSLAGLKVIARFVP
jgi:HlyD family secretion protein